MTLLQVSTSCLQFRFVCAIHCFSFTKQLLHYCVNGMTWTNASEVTNAFWTRPYRIETDYLYRKGLSLSCHMMRFMALQRCLRVSQCSNMGKGNTHSKKVEILPQILVPDILNYKISALFSSRHLLSGANISERADTKGKSMRLLKLKGAEAWPAISLG